MGILTDSAGINQLEDAVNCTGLEDNRQKLAARNKKDSLDQRSSTWGLQTLEGSWMYAGGVMRFLNILFFNLKLYFNMNPTCNKMYFTQKFTFSKQKICYVKILHSR